MKHGETRSVAVPCSPVRWRHPWLGPQGRHGGPGGAEA